VSSRAVSVQRPSVGDALAAEQFELLARRAQQGDDDARARVVELAFPRLRRWAGRYARRGVSREDLTHDAVVGLLRALERFEPSRGVPFMAWAEIWIRQALQQSLAEHGRPVRLTRHALWDLHELKGRHEELLHQLGREPRLIELADALRWPVERVTATLELGQTPERPEALDLLEDPLGEAAYYDVLTRVSADQVQPLLLQLSERERGIVRRRTDGASLREVGRELGISGERVRVLEERALAKVRARALPEPADAPVGTRYQP
jgi:RNA polymerase sigma factor (sigma-70 family)